MKRFALALVLVAGIAVRDVDASEPKLAFRMWTDATGERTVEAALIGLDSAGTTAKFARRNGKTVATPLDGLSHADREFIRGRDGLTDVASAHSKFVAFNQADTRHTIRIVAYDLEGTPGSSADAKPAGTGPFDVAVRAYQYRRDRDGASRTSSYFDTRGNIAERIRLIERELDVTPRSDATDTTGLDGEETITLNGTGPVILVLSRIESTGLKSPTAMTMLVLNEPAREHVLHVVVPHPKQPTYVQQFAPECHSRRKPILKCRLRK